MARRCNYGLEIVFVVGGVVGGLVAGCAAPEKSSDVQGRFSDGGGGHDFAGGSGGADLAGSGGRDLATAAVDLATGGPSDLGHITCVDGGSCNTGNAGACMMGHVACSGPVASCVPDVTTQSCYDGPPATMGVGICHAGTQTCIGALGACGGEVKPAAIENCFNDLDDDCDGVVNNGCPIALAVGTPRPLTREGGPGGGLSQLRCPANTFITRTILSPDNNDAWEAGVTIYCATPTLMRGASSYSVTLNQSATAAGSAVGANASGATHDFPCDTTAFNAGNWIDGTATPNAGAGNYVSGFGMACEAGSLALGGDNKLSITFSHTNAGTYYYYSIDNDPFFESDCANNEVLVGYDVHTGSWMDAIQAICAPLTAVYK